MLHYFKRRTSILIVSMLFFCLGCYFTLIFVKVDCLSSKSNTLKLYNDRNSVEYAIIILTSPGNEVNRDAIRGTWLNLISNVSIENGEKKNKWNHTAIKNYELRTFIQVYFVIGTRGLGSEKLRELKVEQNRFKDLLLLDEIEDNYKNLALKLKSSLKWLSVNLNKLKYVIKCDDDSFIRIDLIIMNLEMYAPNMNSPGLTQYISSKGEMSSYNGLYWGYFDGRAKVYFSGKWEEHDWFLCDNYLPYALGGGYVISRKIVDYIALNAEILSHYTSEDVSMGVWTAALAAINRVHDIRFDTEWKSRGCTNDMLVRHKQKPSDMYEMYRTLVLSHGEKICKTESLSRRPYTYKWNVHPSMCCR